MRKAWRWTWGLAMVAGVVGAASGRAVRADAPVCKVDDGTLAVAVTDLSLAAARGRDLPLRVFYPESGGPYPLIVFSHGAGGSAEAAGRLGRFWASHGYVVVAPTHADSIARRRAAGESASLRDTLRHVGDPGALEGRVADVRLVLGSLDALVKQATGLRGRIDRARVGMSGHSMGAMTGQLVAGARLYRDGAAVDLSDPRPRAFVLLSPQGRNTLLHDDSWKELKRPTLFVTGSQDRGLGGQEPSWRREPFERSPAGDKYLVFIEGATHASFTGKASDGERPNRRGRALARRRGLDSRAEPAKPLDPAEQEAIFDDVRCATLAFWDAYLKGDAQARKFLAGDGLEAFSKGQVELSRR